MVIRDDDGGGGDDDGGGGVLVSNCFFVSMVIQHLDTATAQYFRKGSTCWIWSCFTWLGWYS